MVANSRYDFRTIAIVSPVCVESILRFNREPVNHAARNYSARAVVRAGTSRVIAGRLALWQINKTHNANPTATANHAARNSGATVSAGLSSSRVCVVVCVVVIVTTSPRCTRRVWFVVFVAIVSPVVCHRPRACRPSPVIPHGPRLCPTSQPSYDMGRCANVRADLIGRYPVPISRAQNPRPRL